MRVTTADVSECAGRATVGCRSRPRGGRGFTLIETALATVIIGVGVLALVESHEAFIKSNGWSTHSASGTYLANEVRELTRRLPKHDPVTGLYTQSANGASSLIGWGPDTGETTLDDFDDVDDFDGLSIRYDGTAGLSDNDLPGPIDAFGQIIPEINNDGTAALDGQGNPLALQGWSQQIEVRKVNPTNYSTLMDDDAVLAPDGTGFTGLDVDEFPLRVTVTVQYRGAYDTSDRTVAVVSWIVP